MYEPAVGKTARELVDDLADDELRFPAYFALDRMGSEALAEIEAGLEDERWQVRRWCAALMDHHADDDALRALIPLLTDDRSKVRLWAVHSISCDRCKVGENPVDVVPHLIERMEVDESIRVRRMATAMLGQQCAVDARALPALRRVQADTRDRKLKGHAERALERYARHGLA